MPVHEDSDTSEEGIVKMRPALKYFLLAMLLAAGVASAQQRTGVVTVSVVPDQADWTYQPGEPVPSASTWFVTVIQWSARRFPIKSGRK
jgi:hypothetical protein